MSDWHTDRLPTEADGDLHGLVRWHPGLPGLLLHWSNVRLGEPWAHSAAYQHKPTIEGD